MASSDFDLVDRFAIDDTKPEGVDLDTVQRLADLVQHRRVELGFRKGPRSRLRPQRCRQPHHEENRRPAHAPVRARAPYESTTALRGRAIIACTLEHS
jgi:hypothetical protein